MKQIASLIFITCLVLACHSVFAQSLSFKPANPIPTEKVFIKYNPIGTALERAEKIEIICYQITEDELVAREVYLRPQTGFYTGSIVVSKDAKAVFVSLRADDKKDNNDGNGYGFMVYQKDRKAPQPGACASMASAYGKHYRSLGIERDYGKALGHLSKEYSLHPELKKEGKYLENYAAYAAKSKDEKTIAECKELTKALRQTAKGEEDLKRIDSILRNIGETKAAEAMKQIYLKNYPNGQAAQQEMVNTFYKAKSLEEKLEIYKKIYSKYADSEIVAASSDRINGTLAAEYGKAKDWKNFDKYLALVENPTRKSRTLNSLAWKMSGENVDAKPEHAAKGKELSKQSLDLIENAIASGASKPASRTKGQWKKQLEYTYGSYADTYALCAFHTGDFEEALKFQTMACEASEYENGELNERYAVFFEKVNGTEAVEKELQKLMSYGFATAKMKEQYQRVYMANNTLESALQKNMAFLQSLADEKKMEELERKMIAEKAPDFSLVNLEGEKVALSDLKGKVVILDFWATWCGPCKASFPGMQNAIEKYKNNDNVAFLFLNTWERSDDKEENAQKFIDDKGYTFNVLMDNANEIVAKYKVSGIPTKFIIDKKGNIRFKSTGFSGNNDELVTELSMMIEMANEASSGEKTMP